MGKMSIFSCSKCKKREQEESKARAMLIVQEQKDREWAQLKREDRAFMYSLPDCGSIKTCPKCGKKAFRRLHHCRLGYNYDWNTEILRVICDGCGYERMEKTKDFEELTP
jgi:predicted RNA-binding Zn-ribbon protein involved in translation (DUF1610 family)